MPIRKAPLALQFAGGIETKIDAKQVPTTQLLDLQNCVFVKGTTLSKRNGYAAYSMAVDGEAALYSNPVGLAERDGELLLFDGHRALSLARVDRYVERCRPGRERAAERRVHRAHGDRPEQPRPRDQRRGDAIGLGGLRRRCLGLGHRSRDRTHPHRRTTGRRVGRAAAVPRGWRQPVAAVLDRRARRR